MNGAGVRLNRIGKQTDLAPLGRAFAVLLFFMDIFVFLIFIMAQPHGQMPRKKKLDRRGEKCHTANLTEAALLSQRVGKPIEETKQS